MKKIILSIILLIVFGCKSEVRQAAVGDPISCFKPAKQSSNYISPFFPSRIPYPADKAFDCRNQPLHGANFSQTGLEQYPWLEVDLGGNYSITQIDVINRQDNTIAKGRLKKFRIFVSNDSLTELPASGEVASYDQAIPSLDSISFSINSNGRYVRLWMENTSAANYLSISEMRVWGAISNIVCRDTVYHVPVIRDSSYVVRICDTLDL